MRKSYACESYLNKTIKYTSLWKKETERGSDLSCWVLFISSSDLSRVLLPKRKEPACWYHLLIKQAWKTPNLSKFPFSYLKIGK